MKWHYNKILLKNIDVYTLKLKSYNLMKRLFTSITILLCITLIRAQSFEDYKKQQQQQYQQYQKEVKDGMNKLQAEFDSYVKKRNEEFATFLKNPWKDFKVNEGEQAPADPKPIETPKFIPVLDQVKDQKLKESKTQPTSQDEPTEIRENPPQAISGIPTIKINEPSNPLVDIKPRISITPKPVPNAQNIRFKFYGQPITMNVDPKLFAKTVVTVDEKSTSLFWESFTKANYDPLIESLLDYSYALNLNEWGFYLLTRETANHLAQGDTNTARLITWGLLNQAGYKVRIGYNEGKGYLLVPFVQKVYDHYFVDLKGIRYYILENEGAQIYTYPEDFEGSYKLIDLNVYSPLAFTGDLQTKTYNAPSLSTAINIPVNPNAVKLYNDFPPSELKVYFDAGLTPETKDALIEALKPELEGKSQQAQVQTLLSFAQHAFQYMVDQEQFDREKAFFPDEIFYYPYSDCEDRSILFSFLVRNLTGLDVVGLDYPGHIATAVAFTDVVDGDYYEYKGRKYVVCDPTYLGAPVGATMPQFKGVAAGLIFTENIWKTKQVEDKIWSTLNALGCQAGTSHNIVKSYNELFYATGWFEEPFTFKGKKFSSKGGKDIFLAQFNTSGDLIWIITGGSMGTDMPTALSAGKENCIYLSGSYDQNFSFVNKEVSAQSEKDLFIASVASNGDINWLNSMKLKSIDDGKNLAFVGKFNALGKLISAEYYPETGRPFESGITEINREVYLAGSFNESAGLRKSDQTITHSAETFDYVGLLKKENDELIKKNVEKNMAAIFAALTVLKNNGTLIPGETAQEALNKYNPNFKKTCPEIFRNLGLVDFLKNSDGLIVVKTNATKGVNFDMMKMENNSSMRISNLPNGNAKIDFISGVKVGKAFVWFNLNNVVLEHNTGNLIFDYDNDHTKKTINLKSEVLDI